MRYFGLAFDREIVLPRNVRIATDDGFCLKMAKPVTRREEWSMTTATHQQKGQHYGKANGSQVVQKPPLIGTAVKSTCQTWFGRLAVTTRPVAVSDVRNGWDAEVSCSMRPTVVGARCKPARASTWAIFTLPMVGQSAFSRWTA